MRTHRIAAAGALSLTLSLCCADVTLAGTLLPERGGSPNADSIASLYAVVLVVAGVVFVGVVVALGFSLVRYRARRHPIADQIHGNTRLEIAWTVAASVLIVALAAFSLSRFGGIDDTPPSVVSPAIAATVGATDQGHGPLRIGVVGRQYIWMFKYPNGASSYEELVAPVGVTVQLDIVSVDVAHSWWIPKLGGKFDALPGYVNHTWFRLERPGIYRGQCAELCGRNHADMVAQVRGVSPAAYGRWVSVRQRQQVDATAAVARARARATSDASQGAP